MAARSSLEEVRDYIDWTPFFTTWQLKRDLPQDPRAPRRTARAAQASSRPTGTTPCSTQIIARRRAGSSGQCRSTGLFPAEPATVTRIVVVARRGPRAGGPSPFPHAPPAERASSKRKPQSARSWTSSRPPRERGPRSHRRLRSHGWPRRQPGARRSASAKDHDEYQAIMVQALGDRIAEALAEMAPRARPRRVGLREGPSGPTARRTLIRRARIAGSAPRSGYPACTRSHSSSRALFDPSSAHASRSVVDPDRVHAP